MTYSEFNVEVTSHEFVGGYGNNWKKKAIECNEKFASLDDALNFIAIRGVRPNEIARIIGLT